MNVPVLPARRTWRLIVDGYNGAAWNMAVDEAILDAVSAGIAPPTVRLYRWAEPAITVGRFQSVARGINAEACRERGVPVIRRLTGGRGILHDGDQTVSVVVPAANLGSAGRRVIESYHLLSEGFVRALARLGVSVTRGACGRRRGEGGDCFSVRSQADLLTPEGDKLVGSAQRRREGVILQQSSLRHLPPRVPEQEVFRGPVAQAVYPLHEVEEEALEAALAAGFQEAFGQPAARGALTAWEEERAAALLAHYPDELRAC